MKVLVTGWFSFEHGEATAGDLLARDVACEWLEGAGHPYDVALSPAFGAGVDLWSVDPDAYSDVVFVCGPAKGEQLDALMRRFSGCRLVGLDVSITDDGNDAAPGPAFDFLLERDGPATTRPDISFVARTEPLPVLGLVLGHPQPEYGERSMLEAAHDTIRRALYSRPFCVVPFDTRVGPRPEEFPGAFRSPDEVETLVSRMDLVVTTRMHGLVHALKAGVPVVAVDPISGGAKVRRQAEVVGWPAVLTADNLSEKALQDALDYCLTSGAKTTALACAKEAENLLRPTREEFIAALRDGRPQRDVPPERR